MPRRAAAVRREVQPDAQYNNRLVTQLINKILLDGKKATAENIVYGAFAIVEEKTGGDPLAVFKKAMDNVRPTLEVKPKRVGGATYQVPMEVNSRRATTLAIRWIVDFSRKRKEHTMKERLAAEIMDAAENIVYGAFDLVQEKTGEDPLTVFKKAMDNVRPTLECKPKRVGGATYQVPMEVNSRRATTLAIRWIVDFSRKRKEHTMRERLANEIIDASNNTGAAVKKREDMYKMAEANRAFSHYRF